MDKGLVLKDSCSEYAFMLKKVERAHYLPLQKYYYKKRILGKDRDAWDTGIFTGGLVFAFIVLFGGWLIGKLR